MNGVLLIDIGSTYTKVTAVDLDEEKIVGTARAFTTVESDVNIGLENAVKSLNEKYGEFDYVNRYACSSAAGGLKMVAIGLVPDLTAEAAKRAALSAGAKVMKTYSYELSSREADEIQKLKPDIILLSGGTNGGNKNVILHNAGVVAKIKGDFTIVSAGNKSVEAEVEALITASGKQVILCENVMPEFNVLNIEPAREVIRSVFLQKIIQAKGLTKVQKLVKGILMPTPSAVLNAARLLAEGAGNEKGIGDLMVVDVGGATTDVYSIADGKPTKQGVLEKGLPEPFAKRTVEGDLGVRYSANPLAEVAGMDKIALKSNISMDDVEESLKIIKNKPDILPTDSEKIKAVDFGLAAMAVKLASDRHAGSFETSYTPFGAVFLLTGKDLTKVKKVIGTGGPIINSSNPEGILKEMKFDADNPQVLKPQEPELLLDKKYILAAMGLLGEYHPDIAVRIMKKELLKL